MAARPELVAVRHVPFRGLCEQHFSFVLKVVIRNLRLGELTGGNFGFRLLSGLD